MTGRPFSIFTNGSSSTIVSLPRGMLACPPFTRRAYAASFSGYSRSCVKYLSSSPWYRPSLMPFRMEGSEKAGLASGILPMRSMKSLMRFWGPLTTFGGGVGLPICAMTLFRKPSRAAGPVPSHARSVLSLDLLMEASRCPGLLWSRRRAHSFWTPSSSRNSLASSTLPPKARTSITFLTARRKICFMSRFFSTSCSMVLARSRSLAVAAAFSRSK
mmetsp:Transcript_10978/g.32429  ORF Transcript_10978/g.32429 Transcript_10978/m.32429 type:complete len:216 (+) Transcript_10978:637-1284(+)